MSRWKAFLTTVLVFCAIGGILVGVCAILTVVPSWVLGGVIFCGLFAYLYCALRDGTW